MKAFISKASEDYWYKIKEFNTMEDIQKFIEKCGCEIIIGKNEYTNNNMFKFWKGMKSKDIPIIKKCSLHIIIYDSYVE